MSDIPELLRRFITYRRSELEHERAELSQGGAFGGAAMITFDERAKTVAAALAELERLAEYIDAGLPDYAPPLTSQQKETWRAVKELGYDIPPEIEAQL